MSQELRIKKAGTEIQLFWTRHHGKFWLFLVDECAVKTYTFSSQKYLKLMFGILRDEFQEKGFEVELKTFREGAAPGRSRKAEYFLSNSQHADLRQKFTPAIGREVAHAEVLDVRDYAGFVAIPEQFTIVGFLRLSPSNKPAQFFTDAGIVYETTITGFQPYAGDYFTYYFEGRFHLLAKRSKDYAESYLFCSSLAQYEDFALPERITRTAAASYYDTGETLVGLVPNMEALYFHSKQNSISVPDIAEHIMLLQ